jgi:deoxyxylulose-5-phosphate synthase
MPALLSNIRMLLTGRRDRFATLRTERGLAGFPDQFVSHGDPGRQLSDLGLDVAGIARVARALALAAQERSLRLADSTNPELATG